MRLIPAATLASAISVASCDGKSTAEVSPSRDSAGITIVENAQPRWTVATALSLSESPTLRIGTDTGAMYQFSEVAGAVRLSDGTIVVADGGSHALRFFEASGKFLRTAGRAGDGPDEFRQLNMFHKLSGDTLVAGPGSARVSYFTGSGTFVRQSPAFELGSDARERAMQAVLAVLPDQSLIVAAFFSQPEPPPGVERWIHSMPLYFVSRDGAMVKSLGEFPYTSLALDNGRPSPPWFAPTAAIVCSGNSIVTGLGDEFSIRVHSAEGKLERIIRRAWKPRAVSSAEIDTFVTEWSKRWVKSTGAAAEKAKRELRESKYAEFVPAFAQIIVDDVSRLWVREAHLRDAAWAGSLSGNPVVPSVWSVFDTSGNWLGDVTMPAHFSPSSIGSDYVLGVARDDDAVQTIVMYELKTRGG